MAHRNSKRNVAAATLLLVVLAGFTITCCSAADNTTGIALDAGVLDAPAAGQVLQPLSNETASQVLQPLGNVTDSLPGAELVLSDGATGDCAEPSRVNTSKALAEQADLVITGVVVSAAPGEAACVSPAGSAATTDLVVRPSNISGATDDGAITLLVIVQCVHKGVLACRRNAAQNGTDSLGRCVIAVKVPAQAAANANDTLPPCSVTPGFRYMMLLSSRPQAACDGAYATAHPRIVESIRPHLGTNKICVPYPSWPIQDTSSSGGGVAAALACTCPGAATSLAPADCGGARNGCQGKACPSGAAVSCVAKACEGRFMVQDFVSPVEPCVATFVSQLTGLPVAACDVTANQLLRQSKQASRRTGIATGRLKPTQTQVDAATGRPKLLAPDQLFADKFNASGSGKP